MTTAIEELIEAYLDGELEPDQTRKLESALATPEASAALSRALMLREMLRTAPPELPPTELLEQLHDVVQEQLSGEEDHSAPDGQPRGRFPRLRAALSGASWSLRWTNLAVATGDGGRSALGGLSTMRNALGPLASRGGCESTPAKTQPRNEKQAKKQAKKEKKAKKQAKKAKKTKRTKSKGAGLLGRLLRRK